MKEILVVCALLIALTSCCVFGEHFIHYEDQYEKEHKFYTTKPICKPLHTCDINPITGEITIEPYQSIKLKKDEKEHVSLLECCTWCAVFACCLLFLFFIGTYKISDQCAQILVDHIQENTQRQHSTEISSKTTEEQTPPNKEIATLGPEHEKTE